jgi:flagellar biosynthetic protein FliQ
VTQDGALQLVREMLWTAMLVGAPVIGVAMLVGLVVSVLQVVTQIQEMTLTFVPKLVAIFFVLLLAGGWMLSRLVAYSAALIADIPQLIH